MSIKKVLTIAPSITKRRLHIEGRRWWRRGAGGTYCKVRVWMDGELVWTSAEFGGYGDHYLTVALDWLCKEGLIPEKHDQGTRYVREELNGTYSVVDVAREKDL